MEPFQLVCHSCAAKLKVKNRSAIGQRLACPRCREVILVAAPEGHDIGESLAATGSFDEMDMDSILENRPTLKPKPKPKSASIPAPRPRQTKPGTQSRTQTQTPATQPPNPELAPGQEWVNPATKQKQRLVLIAVSVIGGLLLLGAIVFAILNFTGGGIDEVADLTQNEPGEVVTAGESEDDPEVDLSVGDIETETEGETESTEPVEELPTEVIPDPMTDVGDAPMIALDPDSPPSIPGVGDAAPKPDVEGFGGADEPGKEKPAISTTIETEETIDPAVRELEKLKSILAESGTSLLEIQSAASTVRSGLAVGTPKYFFEKTQFDAIDATHEKDQILLGVKYSDQSLQTVLHELSAISGLVLTVDVPTIAAAGIDVDPQIDLKVENESTGSVIRKVAESAGLVAVETDDGFWITVKEESDLLQRSISVAVMIENEQDGIELARVIRKLVYPGSWKPDDADAGVAPEQQPAGLIGFADGKIEVTNTSVVIREVENLIDGIKSVARGDLEASQLSKPVYWIDAGDFTKAHEGENSIRLSIAKFFQKIADDKDVHLLADWRVLSQSGWTTDAMVPGWIDERSVGDVVQETSHGLGVSFYVANEKTVWLTSPEIANSIFMLKLYPVGDLAGGRLDLRGLNRILFDALGPQLNQPGVSMELLGKQKLAIVRAPQSLQRQINAVFDAME